MEEASGCARRRREYIRAPSGRGRGEAWGRARSWLARSGDGAAGGRKQPMQFGYYRGGSGVLLGLIYRDAAETWRGWHMICLDGAADAGCEMAERATARHYYCWLDDVGSWRGLRSG